MIFCMFATDVGLLPKSTFSDLLIDPQSRNDNEGFRKSLSELFKVMNSGGKFGVPTVPHFNGRLFTDADVPEYITSMEIIALGMLDALNWAEVEPAIFGTLFERILDPNLRKKLGAHYTSRADNELIVEPVLMAPLRREWDDVKKQVEELLDKAETKAADNAATTKRVRSLVEKFHERLATIRVLDPACGSGNFLYVSLALLKALEKEVIAFASIHQVTGLQPRVHPRQLHGLEISPYAVEIASIVIWIGYLQWKHRNVLPLDDEEPILQPLDQIELNDAIVNDDGKAPREPTWPSVDVIVGNPPFLGSKQLRKNLGDTYVDKMFAVWDGRVARESDLRCYWFEKARAAIEAGHAKRAGLLATQGIRGGKNRRVLERIKETGDIFYAQSDRKWIQDGVAVRVSMVGFDDGNETRRRLNELPDDQPLGALDRALPVEGINANLTSRLDVTQARRLKENAGISFMGDTKVGPFDISEAQARRLLAAPNPHGRPNSEVVRPWVNGLDVTRRPRDMWIIDFPPGMTETDAALYEAPFEYVREKVKPERAGNARKLYAAKWWIHGEPRPEMRRAVAALDRFIATVRVPKYRMFTWVENGVLCDSSTIVFARDDDYFFGVLHSRVHEVWARKQGTQLREVSSGFRYTPTACFETFPFPDPTDAQRAAVADAAKALNDWRRAWLNPRDDGVGMTAAEKKKRTLTNLYN
jgi:type II restriction/modification system DNA methylase subunit YeeA